MQHINRRNRRIAGAALLAITAGLAATAYGQAVQLPASGRGLESAGQVMAGQMTLPAGASVVQPSVMVAGSFAGSVVKDSAPGGALRLTMAEAVKRGLDANLGVITSETVSATVRAQRLQALSQMLPQVSGSVSANVVQTNLATTGFTSIMAGIPQMIGPFQFVQAQANFNWNALSLTSVKNVQAANAMNRAVQLNARDARELVVLAVGGSYLQLVAEAASIASEREQVRYAEAIFHRVETQLSAGTTTRVDRSRSKVQLQAEQERLLSLEGDFAQQKIAFARMIGLAQDQEVILTERLESSELGALDESEALHSALEHRWDLLSADAQKTAAERALAAARGERLPSLSVNGYYGVNGTHPSQSHGAFVAQGTVSFPIFSGGRIGAEIQQAQAALRQRQAEYEDRKAKVEQDVRTAVIQLRTAEGQVKLAQSNRELARETLEQSQDRFEAGVTNTVEVVQAQQQLASAEHDSISSLFAWNLARLNLARATGSAESQLATLFAGRQN